MGGTNKKYRLRKANETPEQKAVRLEKGREYWKRKILNESPLQRETRLAIARVRARRKKISLRCRKAKLDKLYNNKNKVEEKPIQKKVRRKPITTTLKNAETEKILPAKEDIDWQDIFTNKLLGLEENPKQQPEIKLKHKIEGEEYLARNEYSRTETVLTEPTIGQEVDDDVVERPSNVSRIKEEEVVNEIIEDIIEFGDEVKQEYIWSQPQQKVSKANIPNILFQPKREADIDS